MDINDIMIIVLVGIVCWFIWAILTQAWNDQDDDYNGDA